MKLNINAIAAGTVAAIWFITIITIWAEFVAPLKNFLAGVTGHHWVTKGVFAVALFALVSVGWALADKNSEARPTTIYVAIASTILGSLTLFLFFVWHFFA